jgi:hypothetical protein
MAPFEMILARPPLQAAYSTVKILGFCSDFCLP